MKSLEAKKVLTEVLLESLNESSILCEEDYEHEFRTGQKWGLKDKLSGTTRDISTLPAAFQKGYNSVRKEPWWQKFNAKLADYLARMGSSRLR